MHLREGVNKKTLIGCGNVRKVLSLPTPVPYSKNAFFGDNKFFFVFFVYLYKYMV